MFNEICINEEMLPKYTYFKLHDPAACEETNYTLYSSNMLKQKLHHFCNRSSPDDGPKLGRKY